MAAFVIDVILRGPVEEAGSLVVVGRLWRVFKIIEEFSSGAEDQILELEERIEELELHNDKVVKENQELRFRARAADGHDRDGGDGGTTSGRG